MAKVVFQIDPPQILHTFRVDPGPDYKYSIDETDQDNYTVVDSDVDETVVHFSNLKLSADKTKVEVIDSSKTYEESKAAFIAAVDVKEIAAIKLDHADNIRGYCANKLQDLEWKWQRATEQDLINGNNVAKTAVASEKQAIRDANNAHQTAMEALTTLAELKAFDPKDF